MASLGVRSGNLVRQIDIHAEGLIEVTRVQTMREAQPYVQVYFSDRLDAQLVGVEGEDGINKAFGQFATINEDQIPPLNTGLLDVG